MAATDRLTSVSLRSSTLHQLQQMKSGAQNWDQFFRDWLIWTMEREELEEARRAIAEIRSGSAKLVPLGKVKKEVLAWAEK